MLGQFVWKYSDDQVSYSRRRASTLAVNTCYDLHPYRPYVIRLIF